MILSRLFSRVLIAELTAAILIRTGRLGSSSLFHFRIPRIPRTKTVFTRYGKCLTFNNPDQRDRIKQTLKGGVDNGMELILDLQQHEFMPVWSNNDELSIEAGFKVQIHSQDEPPFIHELGKYTLRLENNSFRLWNFTRLPDTGFDSRTACRVLATALGRLWRRCECRGPSLLQKLLDISV